MRKDCGGCLPEGIRLGPLLGHVAHLTRERMDARLARYDVTPTQTHVLLYLAAKRVDVPQRDVVEHLRVKPPTANGILDRLEEKRLISRRADPKDQRQKRVELTEKGRELQEQLQLAFDEGERTIFRCLTEEENGTLRALLSRIIENLEEDRTQC